MSDSLFKMTGHTLPGPNQASPLKKPIGTPGHTHPHSDVKTTRTKDSITLSSKKRGTSSTYKVTNKKQNKDGTTTYTFTNDLGNTRKEVHSSSKGGSTSHYVTSSTN